MMLQPGQSAPIVRQLGLPGDSSTYYVRSVVRNSSTGATIATVNLTDGGNQRFTGTFTCPADPLGFGYYIDITTSVYTDSGYTTLSNLYTIDMQTHLVFDRLTWGRNVGGGGDATDYEKIRKMVKEEVQAIEFPKVTIPKPQKVDLDPVIATIWESEKRISGAIDNVNTKSKDDKVVKVLDRLGKEILAKMDEKTIVARLESMVSDLRNAIAEETRKGMAQRKSTESGMSAFSTTATQMLGKVEEAIKKIGEVHDAVKEETDTERTEKIVEAVRGMGHELATLFTDTYENSENAASNLVNALAGMAKKKPGERESDDVEEMGEKGGTAKRGAKPSLESPYLKDAENLTKED